MPVASPDELLERRVAALTADDPQFAAAQPLDAVAAAADQPGRTLASTIRVVLDGYAERPALGERAVEFVADPATGRTTAALLGEFTTISYRELADRVDALARAWAVRVVRPGDRVAVLGFTSIDYTVIDVALTQLGAVSVPLQTSAAISQLEPIIVETEPVVLAASMANLADAVALIQAGYTSATPARLVVFDYLAAVDDHRDALAAARTALADTAIAVETLSEVLEYGATAEPVALPDTAADALALLIYTSGSTGAPKGAMYPADNAARMWRRANKNWFGPSAASITLNFMPMSHVMGRGILYGTLANGGTAYFAARSDLSTLLDDLALVRPTELNFVPRIWEMLFQEFQADVDRRIADGADRAEAEAQVRTRLREQQLGGRFISVMTGSAPISAELKDWVETLVDQHVLNGYGSTEAGMVTFDGEVQRPPVLDYKLVDVPDLGYFATDHPYPRGELLVKTENMFPGYYRRPEVTAEVFDADGFYRTGDVVAELEPDHLVYVDRRNNVLKLAQGEFVTLAKLEAVFGNSPLVRQVYLYGNSAQPYLLAVVVPTPEALSANTIDELKPLIADSLQSVAKENDLQSYEVPRDFLVETTPFSLENGLLTGIRKLAWPKLKAHYGPRLEQRYIELADSQAGELNDLRRNGADAPVPTTVARAAAALLGAARADISPDVHFTDLGGDSLSALTFANLLHEIFGVDVPVGVIVSPASNLADLADYIESERAGSKRPTFAAVHGRDAVEVAAADLTLDRFLDAATLAAAPGLPGPTDRVRTVLLTGATGFLGRYLALDALQRLAPVGGELICVVRAKSDTEAHARLDATFDSGDPALLARYRELADGHLRVIAGDKSEPNLGLPLDVWQQLADEVDAIVDPAALVNHVLPYSQLFGPNAAGTAELLRLALTTRIKPYTYVSTIGVGDQIPPGEFTEDADVRVMSPIRAINDGYANGYGTSKWAGEVLLAEANDLCGLPVAVFRCDMILADTSYAGQLNVPDMFTRTMLSLVATGVAPKSFYETDSRGNRQRSHYDGLPVEFIAEAIGTLGARAGAGFATYHVMNPYDDGLGMDEFVDWLIDAGHPIKRIDDYGDWLARFETSLRALPEQQRGASLLPLLHNYQKPAPPLCGSFAPTERFRAAVQDAKIGAEKDIPHVSREIIVKYVTDLQLLGLL